MDFIWIFIAFVFGLGVRSMSLPPMIGYLVAGFVLHYAGVQPEDRLQTIANLGITLMLFTIGLKLRLATLLRPEIWATTILHMGMTILLALAALLAFGWAGVLLFDGLDFSAALIIAFALSFSSTVFAINVRPALRRTAAPQSRQTRLAQPSRGRVRTPCVAKSVGSVGTAAPSPTSAPL